MNVDEAGRAIALPETTEHLLKETGDIQGGCPHIDDSFQQRVRDDGQDLMSHGWRIHW